MSKILVITGSPRKEGNSNEMAETFIEVAESKGHEVKRIDTAMMKLNGCHACGACFKTGKACAFDDDFNKYADDVLAADVIVVTSPIYWYGVPGMLKAFTDNFYCYMGAQKDISGKRYAVLACAAEPDEEVFTGMKYGFDKSFALNGWEKLGDVYQAGVYEAGDIENTDALERVKALVEKI